MFCYIARKEINNILHVQQLIIAFHDKNYSANEFKLEEPTQMVSAAYPVACCVYFSSFTFFILTQTWKIVVLDLRVFPYLYRCHAAVWQLATIFHLLPMHLPDGIYIAFTFRVHPTFLAKIIVDTACVKQK
jgi:hypothetical protein